MDRFENYHCDVKKAKAIPEKHISSRVMSHTKNESWPGIYRKIKKERVDFISNVVRNHWKN